MLTEGDPLFNASVVHSAQAQILCVTTWHMSNGIIQLTQEANSSFKKQTNVGVEIRSLVESEV